MAAQPHGVPILVGSDKDVHLEVFVLRDFAVFSNPELLNMVTCDTAQGGGAFGTDQR